MTKRLNDNVALDTGGTSGIGLSTAKRFVNEGATVIVRGTNPASLEVAHQELGETAQVHPSDEASHIKGQESGVDVGIAR